MLETIHFISANRRGPTKYVDKHEIPELHRVGKDGDYTINTLASYNELLKSDLKFNLNEDSSTNLQSSTSIWMSYIMDGGGIIGLQGIERSSSVLSMRITGANTKDNQFSPENVGFGYSYILSIIVTALIAKPGSIVIIENPEAHLHPAAQSRMTHLLSHLAERGVQVIIETHSEHILNGFRLCALKDDFKISNDDLSIYFFDKDFSIIPLKVQPNGRINNWPKGFFDQQENDMAEIIRIGMSK
jgi:predicted ATPase